MSCVGFLSPAQRAALAASSAEGPDPGVRAVVAWAAGWT